MGKTMGNMGKTMGNMVKNNGKHGKNHGNRKKNHGKDGEKHGKHEEILERETCENLGERRMAQQSLLLLLVVWRYRQTRRVVSRQYITNTRQ